MNTNIQGLNPTRDLDLCRQRCRKGDLRVDRMYLRYGHTDKRERNRVVSWIAVLEMRTSIVGVMAYLVMLMHGQSVVVLRMTVIAVEVCVQRRHDPGRRYQSENQQQRQDAVHNDQSMGRGRRRSKGPQRGH